MYILNTQGTILLNSLPNDKFLDLSKLKAFAHLKINVREKSNLFWEVWKRLWEKEELLVTSIFSFSLYVFKRLLSQGRLKLGLCSKELICVSYYILSPLGTLSRYFKGGPSDLGMKF